ncbi:MAG TPA: endonuclease III [Nanoarchaeota archaeon]|nr:endonuclease III [Nanoarchaeota archaeon]
MDKKDYFLKIFKLAEKKYGAVEKRLAAEEWAEPWQTLVATIMSAQSRDEATLPIAEKLFTKYNSLEKLAGANYKDVLEVFKSLNYNKTKARHVIAAAKYILENFNGVVPEEIEKLTEIPGVGRKTANIVRVEVHGRHAIPVDTHVHRISNVLGLVKTKTPTQTEFELMKIIPKKYRSKVNRIFVLWGKDATGRDKEKLLAKVQPI